MRSVVRSIGLLGTMMLLLTGVASAAHAASSVRQAPIGHRQPTAQDVQSAQEGNSADEAMKKIDEDLDKKLKGICRGC